MKQQLNVPSMVKWVAVVFIILLVVGYIHLPLLDTPIFSLSGRPFTLHTLLIIVFLGYIIRFLPGILQTIVAILIGFWLLSTFVFPAFGGIMYILLIIFVLYLLFSFV